jgi:ribokinase
VLVAGSINTDLVVRVRRSPKAGETVTGTAFEMFGGGKGANQAVAAARCGAETAMLGAVGIDDFGASRLRDLEEDGVYTGTIRRDAHVASGVALITVEHSGQNRIAYVPGASWEVTQEEAIAALNSWQPAFVLATLELPHDVLRLLFDEARNRGSVIVCNATPEPSGGVELAMSADILIVNETEATELLGPANHSDWADLSDQLLERGPSTVIITLGEKGALIATAEASEQIPAPHVDVIDTTGAGDAFCGAFVAWIAAGSQQREAARAGVVAGSLAVTRAGAQPSIPTREEVERLMETVD